VVTVTACSNIAFTVKTNSTKTTSGILTIRMAKRSRSHPCPFELARRQRLG
jgi:ribosomal protein L31